MKLGFDKAKVTCFKCKQKGNFKRECSNRQADDSVVAEIKRSREEEEARGYLSHKDCFVDPKGNPIVDPDVVDFEVLVAAIPTVGVWCRGLKEIPRYREKIEEGIYKVIYACLENKKKIVGEIVDESKKMVNELKKTADEKLEKLVDEAVAGEQLVKKVDEKAEEAVIEKLQVMEDQKNMAKEAKMPNVEVIIQTESSEMLYKSNNKTEQECKKCMEMYKACTEKDNNMRSRDIEFTKIEKIFKEKCNEILENEKFLRQENEKLTQKCENLEKENEVLKQKCLVECNECIPKDKTIQELQKEYDGMKLSCHTVKEVYEILKSKVTSLDNKLPACQETTKFLEARYERKQKNWLKRRN
ncbi:putative transcription factor interactor and regulator CCHC(Zn) family [Helianthus anomalus]